MNGKAMILTRTGLRLRGSVCAAALFSALLWGGVAFGQEMMAMGRETKAVSDVWPSPRAGALTRGADQVCGVG